jgi:predicted enzyme related to lactoylglutathione lyase
MSNPSASDLLGTFVWYDQMSNDLKGAETFYSKVVGWTLAPNTMNAQQYSLLKAGETMVGGLMPIPEEAEGTPSAWMGYIAVDDVKAYADKVKAAGGMIHRPPADIPNVGTFAVAAIPMARGSCCSRATATRRPRMNQSPRATSGGVSCMPATGRTLSPSIRASSAGPRAKRWIWVLWASTRSSTPKAGRAAA